MLGNSIYKILRKNKVNKIYIKSKKQYIAPQVGEAIIYILYVV